MVDHLRTDLDQLLAQRRLRPVPHFIGLGESSQEVAEIVGECVKLKPDRIVAEPEPNLPVQRGFSVQPILDFRRAAVCPVVAISGLFSVVDRMSA